VSDSVPNKTKGERLEGAAFSFCKAATVALVFQQFALPAAAILTAIFFMLAYFSGKKDTRCVLHYPLAISVFWLVVAVVWAFAYFS
jgi:4-hydroxybenzoate polyprenyltransferase